MNVTEDSLLPSLKIHENGFMNPPQNIANSVGVSKVTNNIAFVLDENNQAYISLPKHKKSLLRAISFALNFTTDFADEILSKCLAFLKSIIQSQIIPNKLASFRNNISLFKDYSENPYFGGFDKITLQLVSHVLKTRILVYNITQDSYLQSTIINNKHSKTIELLRTDNHYDVVYTKEKYEGIEICQEILYDLVRAQFGILKVQLQEKNVYFNTNIDQHDSSNLLATATTTSTKHESKLKKHKKSLSDTFNINLNLDLDKEEQSYNMFMNYQPPKDFLKIINPTTRVGGGAGGGKIPIANPYFNTEARTYPYSTTNQTSGFTNIGAKLHSQALENEESKKFNKEIIIDEIEPSDLAKNNMKSPIYFVNTHPPGITPTKPFNNKFNFTGNRENQPEIDPKNPNQNMFKKTSTKNLILDSFMDPEDDIQKFVCLSTRNTQDQPKKPIILDDSKARYTGRLKFFDETKDYGFLIMDEDESDIFVHYDDLSKAGITKEFLRNAKQGHTLKFSFSCLSYIGKYKKSRKAVDIKLLPLENINANF